MKKEEKEERNHVLLITVLIIALLVVFFFLGYAIGGVRTTKDVMNKAEEEKETIKEKENEKEEVVEKMQEESQEKVTKEQIADDELVVKIGECPFYKFGDNYVLSDSEKDEIIETLDVVNIHVDKSTLEVGYTKNYYITINFLTIENVGSPLTAILYKVNQKYKYHSHGSAFTKDYVDQLDTILNHICA